MTFVDTGGWFASVVPWDANHAAAVAWLSQNQETLVTTDYVLDETLTFSQGPQRIEPCCCHWRTAAQPPNGRAAFPSRD